MLNRVRIVGSGRVGSAIGARLRERGIGLTTEDPELVLLCVPDSAIQQVAEGLPTGPWVAHVSGATSLEALSPHTRRFGLHPLQTFNRTGSPDQLDGAWAAVTAEDGDARACGLWLADCLGLRAFEIPDGSRMLYHAGAAIASNYLVTLYRCAARLFREAGAPPEALVPLMRRTIDNGFDLTGPIARGDWATVDGHLAAIRQRAPDIEPVYEALARVTAP
jgi:predicted short-subunit dehydrogenase-like oxidoreductase (DUF2520 family)